ncbi:AAA family ATPase [Roseibacillus persicicus]
MSSDDPTFPRPAELPPTTPLSEVPPSMPELPTPDPSFAMLTQIRKQIERVFVGQEKLVEYVLVAFVSGGHVLIEGHPGLGKTHLVLSLAETFHGVFKRIQFTPDLMPSDVTGHSIFDMAKQSFQVKQGPVFTNLLLADEVNRAPAKTQSALLEVMQERQATIDGVSYPLPKPFMVLATQNPVEQDGTYPLPEAQLDRFMMKLLVDEPGLEDEILIATRATRSGMESLAPEQIDTVCSPEDIEQLRESLTSITISPSVIRYAVQLVQATRSSEMTSYGASPRASISLVQAAKGFAMLRERDYVVPDDVKGCALQVLRHRIRLTPEVAISGQTVDETVAAIINSVEAPRQ